MGLNDTVKRMRELIAGISVDLEKAVGGNKAASQRVRTATIQLEKVAKKYRKESIAFGKQDETKKKAKPAAKAKAKPAAKKAQAQPKAKTAAKARSTAKVAKVKARPKAKAFKNPARRKTVALKRQTAKLPVRRES